MKKYYVYIYWRLDINEPFYVGKGHGDRWKRLNKRSDNFKRIIDKHPVAVEIVKNNLTENGILIIDNLEFHGYVGKSKEIKSRNLRQMVRKIEKFIDFLNTQEEYSVEYIEVGDRLGVCKKK